MQTSTQLFGQKKISSFTAFYYYLLSLYNFINYMVFHQTFGWISIYIITSSTALPIYIRIINLISSFTIDISR